MGVSNWPDTVKKIQDFLKDTAYDGHTNDGPPLKAMPIVRVAVHERTMGHRVLPNTATTITSQLNFIPP